VCGATIASGELQTPPTKIKAQIVIATMKPLSATNENRSATMSFNQCGVRSDLGDGVTSRAPCEMAGQSRPPG